jgi:hypothetical protein
MKTQFSKQNARERLKVTNNRSQLKIHQLDTSDMLKYRTRSPDCHAQSCVKALRKRRGTTRAEVVVEECDEISDVVAASDPSFMPGQRNMYQDDDVVLPHRTRSAMHQYSVSITSPNHVCNKGSKMDELKASGALEYGAPNDSYATIRMEHAPTGSLKYHPISSPSQVILKVNGIDVKDPKLHPNTVHSTKGNHTLGMYVHLKC